jgi:YfiH family protein
MAPLERVQATNGVVTYRSTLLAALGVAHGFGTRIGGISPAPFDSLNLGIAQAPGEPDTEEHVAENGRRLLEAVGAPGATLVRIRQVHGNGVVACGATTPGGPPTCEGDALVTCEPGVAACMRTADCVPVLVACGRSGAVAAIHAGWRGLAVDVIGAAVARMRADHGADPAAMVAAIGPCIGAAVYEVGPDVARDFAAAGLGACVLPAGAGRAKEHLDCFGAARQQLLEAGLRAGAIDGEELCTVANPRDFFSYRRDGARSGRLAAVILRK